MSEISPQLRYQLEQIRLIVATQLDTISKILPEGYKLTFVARHAKIIDAQMVVTEDDDLEAVARELLKAKILL